MFRKRLTDKAAHTTPALSLVVISPAYTTRRCSKWGTRYRRIAMRSGLPSQYWRHAAHLAVNAVINIPANKLVA